MIKSAASVKTRIETGLLPVDWNERFKLPLIGVVNF